VSLFVDTGFFFALADDDDADHERVREVFETLDPQRLRELSVTTNHVVAETITLATSRRGLGHAQAVRLGEVLYTESLARASIGRRRVRNGRPSPTSRDTTTSATASSTA